MDPYENLANAIILQAAKDYRAALKRTHHHPHDRDAAIKRAECERFFRSGWFGMLTSLDAEELIRRLQMEVQ